MGILTVIIILLAAFAAIAFGFKPGKENEENTGLQQPPEETCAKVRLTPTPPPTPVPTPTPAPAGTPTNTPEVCYDSYEDIHGRPTGTPTSTQPQWHRPDQSAPTPQPTNGGTPKPTPAANPRSTPAPTPTPAPTRTQSPGITITPTPA